MESGTANLLQMLEDRVRELSYQEKWDEAVHAAETAVRRSEEHTSELQSRRNLVCRLLLEKNKKKKNISDSVSSINMT